MRGKRKGFTLIELLVVIAIIAILAAILFPVFARARENARKSTCQSNEKQILLGFTMYAQDYDGAFPMQWIRPASTLYCWPDLVLPYVKNSGVYQCPSIARGTHGSPTILPTYGTNCPHALPEGWRTPAATIRQDMFQQPTSVLLIVDSWTGTSTSTSCPSAFCPVCEAWTYTNGWMGSVGAVHMDGCNAGFMDGHVKWYKATTVWQAPTSSANDLWGHFG